MHATTVTALEQRLRAEGFAEGAPLHLDPAAVAIDLRTYRRLRCSECGHGAHGVRPQHRGRQYRLLCSCRRCGNQVEG